MHSIMIRVESIRGERYSFTPIESIKINLHTLFGKPEKYQEGVKVGFVLRLECSPPIASIDIRGTVFIAPQSEIEKKIVDEILEGKAIPSQILISVYAYTLPILALISRELGLPPPCPPPIPPSKEGSTQYHV